MVNHINLPNYYAFLMIIMSESDCKDIEQELIKQWTKRGGIAILFVNGRKRANICPIGICV